MATTTETMATKNHVTKSSKSIDRICAKLHLNADGVSPPLPPPPNVIKSESTNQNALFVDINDVISKQKNDYNIDKAKNFDINGNSVQSSRPSLENSEEKEDLLAKEKQNEEVKEEEEEEGIGEKMNFESKMVDDFSTDIRRNAVDSSDQQPHSVEYSPPIDEQTRHTIDELTRHTTSSEYSESCSSEHSQTIDVVMPAEPLENNNLQVTSNKVEDDKGGKVKPRHPTQYNTWHYQDMLKAINAVQSKNLSMTAAAKKFQIPRTTLRHYLNDGTNRDKRVDSFSLPRECEGELVQFILDNRNSPEKILYKMIFEKAKVLSQVTSNLTQGEEKKRHQPTPAWIRRFVYRHKPLYDLFPTCLKKFEHPLHGGKKNLTSMATEEYQQNDYEYLVQEPSFVGGGGGRGEDISRQQNGTEIIYPTVDQLSRRREHNSDESEQKYEPFNIVLNTHSHANERLTRGYADTRTHEYKPTYNAYSKCSMVTPDREADNREAHLPSQHNNTRGELKIKEEQPERTSTYSSEINQYRSSGEVFKTFKENYDSFAHHNTNSPTTIIHQPAHLEIRRSPVEKRSHPDLYHPYNDSKHRHPIITIPSVAMVNTSSVVSHTACKTPTPSVGHRLPHKEHLTNGLHEMDAENISEIGMTKELLQVMENKLGFDYVTLFHERYARNSKVERMYSKWVQLKAMVDCLESRGMK